MNEPHTGMSVSHDPGHCICMLAGGADVKPSSPIVSSKSANVISHALTAVDSSESDEEVASPLAALQQRQSLGLVRKSIDY